MVAPRMTSRELVIGGCPMVVRDLTPEDMPDVLALHQRVFGGPVNTDWYQWKYALGGGEAVGVWCGDELIAHCAGFPRLFLRQGRSEQHLQIGDVMVAPEWRGILTRKGPFFHASNALYASRLGPEKPYTVGFGFPNARHMRLAEKAGLSWVSGALHELEWTTLPPSQNLGWLWRTERVTPSDACFDQSVASAWQHMQENLAGLTLGDRSARHLRWRYAMRPGAVHHFFQIRRPWGRLPVGIAVLGPVTPEQPVHWLDWIGPTDMLGLASRLCRIEAARLGASSVLTWASACVEACLPPRAWVRRTEVACIGVPVASAISSEEVQHLNAWFMSGDTDFL